MAMLEMLGVLVLAFGAWLFWGNLKARESANVAIRAACRMEGLLFLDDTVGLESVWPARDEEGRITLRRVYGFEFSDTGNDRRKGYITFVGDRVSTLNVGPRPVREGDTWQ